MSEGTRKETEEAHIRPHARSADCEETVKTKNFLTKQNPCDNMVNVRRGKQKANPTIAARKAAEREGVS